MFPHLMCVSVHRAVVQKQSAAVRQVAQAAEQQQADGGDRCGHRCSRLQSVLKCNDLSLLKIMQSK